MIINTRADLDTVAGTPAYDNFMVALRGTLFNVRKDNMLQQWVADETNDLIEKFGFVRSDFDPITPPVLPEYKPEPPEVFKCTPWQIRKALNQLNLRDQVEAMVATSTDRDLKDGWEFAEVFLSNDPFVITMGVGLGKDEAEIAELIQWAGTL